MFQIKNKKKVDDFEVPDDITGVLSLEITELLDEASKIPGKLKRQMDILADCKEELLLINAAMKAEYATLYTQFHKSLDKPTKDLILAHVESSETYRDLITEGIYAQTKVNKQKAIVETLSKKAKMINAMLYPLSDDYKLNKRHASLIDDITTDYVIED